MPASTANLGPGFDCMGCAVALRNKFVFSIHGSGDDQISVTGPGSNGIPATSDNLAVATMRDFLERKGVGAPAVHMHAHIEVPNARGLGSSSTAIVAGLGAGNFFLGTKLTADELLDEAVAIEGHPDNVAPAMLGSLVVAATHSRPLAYIRVNIHPSFRFLFIVPDYMVKTSDARRRLPTTIPFGDAIFNSSRAPLVAMALQSGEASMLRVALEDRLHTNYRKDLFKGYDAFASAAVQAGALGFCVSGAGPTMLAICTADSMVRVKQAAEKVLADQGIQGTVWNLQPDQNGMIVTPS
ncbi:homoserine kinase [Candidatus Sumerlaeota bacterium]|nr:homoserine kinase [Candidatus Sumerlaeota bacterium]